MPRARPTNPHDTTTGSSPSPEPDPDAAARRPRARKGEGPRLRAEIMAATEKLLLSAGSAENVSIRGVADAVKVTPPSIYRHFADKETLIAEVCARHFAVLGAEMEKAVNGLDDPIDRLIARGAAYMRFGVANPEPYRILFMTRTHTVSEKQQQGWLLGSKVFADTVDAVTACLEAGRLHPRYDDAYQVALALWARVHGLTSLAVSKPFLDELTDDGFITDYAAACVYGIASP